MQTLTSGFAAVHSRRQRQHRILSMHLCHGMFVHTAQSPIAPTSAQSSVDVGYLVVPI